MGGGAPRCEDYADSSQVLSVADCSPNSGTVWYGDVPRCLLGYRPAPHTVPAIAGSAGLNLGKLECCWTRRNGMSGRRPLVGWRSLPLKHAGGLVNRPLFLEATVRIFPAHSAPNQLDSATAIPSIQGSTRLVVDYLHTLPVVSSSFLPDPSSPNFGRNSTRSIPSLSIDVLLTRRTLLRFTRYHK